MNIGYKVVAAAELALLGVVMDEVISTTVIVGNKYFDGRTMRPLKGVDVAAIKPLDGIGGKILNLSGFDFLFEEEDNGIGYIPYSGMFTFKISKESSVNGSVHGIPRIGNSAVYNIQRIPVVVPLIVDDNSRHEGRGRPNTFTAGVTGKTGTRHSNGCICIIPYIKHLVSCG